MTRTCRSRRPISGRHRFTSRNALTLRSPRSGAEGRAERGAGGPPETGEDTRCRPSARSGAAVRGIRGKRRGPHEMSRGLAPSPSRGREVVRPEDGHEARRDPSRTLSRSVNTTRSWARSGGRYPGAPVHADHRDAGGALHTPGEICTEYLPLVPQCEATRSPRLEHCDGRSRRRSFA